MTTTYYGNAKLVPFGVVAPLPLRGFPAGLMRIRIRHKQFVVVRVKTTDGIREFYPTEIDGVWVPHYERGRNCTPPS